MTELFLFDKQCDTGQELANEGMTRAVQHADAMINEPEKWSSMAFNAIVSYIKSHKEPFQAEDVRQYADWMPAPPSHRAWGAVFLKASRLGIIKAIGYSKVNNPLAHSTPATVWEAV